MNLAINAAFNPAGGSLTQLVNMVKYFPSSDDNLNLVIYVNKKTKNLLEEQGEIVGTKCEMIVCILPGLSVIFRIPWEQLILPFLLLSKNIDVLFCPGNISPLFTKCKTITWIGTIGPFYKEFYQNFNLINRIKLWLNKMLMITSAYRSDAIIFESNFTKNLFIDSYGIKSKRSHVINIGNDTFYKRINNKEYPDLDKRFNGFIPYALCVSHLYPYKNILNMLDAFKKSVDTLSVNLKLLIAGSRDYKYYETEILKKIDDLLLKKDVILLGSVSKEELRYLYSNCELMIFPSPFENFAYTLVEAMKCGAPIVCSNTTAMPETCGNAALYFDPYNVDDMANSISKVIKEKDLSASMIKKSLKRANELPDYSEVTIKTLKIIKSLIS